MNLVKYKKNGFLFVTVTLTWTWSVLAIPIMWGLDFNNVVTKVAYVLAGASPSVFGLIFALLSGGREYMYSIMKRSITIGNANRKTLLIVFTMVPSVTLFSAYVSLLFTSVYPDFSKLCIYAKDLIRFIIFAAFTFIFGPLAEEIGWRGYLIDCWKNRGILVYGAGIGLIWTIWHLPMFFIDGTYQNSLLLQGTVPIVCFALSTISLSIIIGYITRTTDSILLAILFHFTINFTGEIIPLTLTGDKINTIVLILISSGIIYRNLAKGENI